MWGHFGLRNWFLKGSHQKIQCPLPQKIHAALHAPLLEKKRRHQCFPFPKIFKHFAIFRFIDNLLLALLHIKWWQYIYTLISALKSNIEIFVLNMLENKFIYLSVCISILFRKTYKNLNFDIDIQILWYNEFCSYWFVFFCIHI